MALNRFIFKLAAPAVFMVMSTTAAAGPLEEFYQYFQSGQYPKALSALEKIHVDENSLSSKAYLSGLSYSRMQEYDKASAQFEIAIKYKNDSVDLYYEYGQALYASNELKKAREAFKISAEKQFNRPASLYYVAHISQILENFDLARDYYLMVVKEKSSDAKMKQIAYFQLGETMLAIAREKSKTPDDLVRRVDKFILPMFASALKQDKNSTLAMEINQRTSEIMVEFGLDPNLLINGRRINPKRYGGYIAQRVRYDNNVTLVNEENNVQQSTKNSAIFETEGYAKYDFALKKRYIVSPEARFIYTKYANQSDSDVYQNDAFTFNAALKNKYEHTIKDLPASLIFDFDYAYTQKDWHAQKKKEYYANSKTLTLGESFSYFAIGDTTLRIKRRIYDGANSDISNHTTSINGDQTFFLKNHHLLLAFAEASFIDNYNSEETSTNTYMVRFDYIIPEIRPLYTLDIALATTMTDTKEQKSTRGTEMSWNPSIDFARDLNSNARISLNYDFTKNTSDSTSYAYSKHVITAEFRYAF
jgi:hypothetical protein